MNLYLVSASPENLNTTLLGSVHLNDVANFLSSSQQLLIASTLDGADSFHCWAMTKNLRNHFSLMEIGDVVLISEHRTGQFNYAARVIGKLENENLGNHLWPLSYENPWKLIYLLDNITKVAVNKPKLLTELGYNPTDAVQKSRRVRDAAVTRVTEKYGSIPAFLTAIGVRMLWLDPAQIDAPELERNISTGAGFGDPETNKLVERSAVECVTKQYKAAGWNVTSVEAEKCGYDLLCKKGKEEEHVEVKGVRGAVVSFIITAGEVRRAKNDQSFVLQVVTNSLSDDPRCHRFTGAEFRERFQLAEIAYKASIRSAKGHQAT